jgi:hypothetical protein
VGGSWELGVGRVRSWELGELGELEVFVKQERLRSQLRTPNSELPTPNSELNLRFLLLIETVITTF